MNKHTGLMALSSHSIVNNLAEKRGITISKALDLYYNSKLYTAYERESTKVWHFSNVTLANLLNQEIENGYIDFPVEG